MAETDWTFLLNSASAASVDRGVTTGTGKPNGGGNFAFGFNSLVNDQSVVGLYVNGANFTPMASGG